MVLEHQLSACYAAGSLGRLGDSLRRLSRAHSTGSREKPGGAEARFPEPAKLARLNQTLRLMSDAWQCRITASRQMDHIDKELDRLRESALSHLGTHRKNAERLGEYQLLAQALANLKALEQKAM
jgi:hypothetical protein